jgi:hypothetical protein
MSISNIVLYCRSIIFYRFPDLKLLSTINIHKKNITCLAWYRTLDPNGNVNLFRCVHDAMMFCLLIGAIFACMLIKLRKISWGRGRSKAVLICYI